MQTPNASYKRIMIFGLPGSGKSHLALQLSKLLNLPVHHLDKYFFVENWIERDKEEFLKIQKSLVDQNTWIIDGNSIRSLEMRFSRADLALHLHFNRFICLWRIIKRVFCKNPHIEDRAEGCPERLSLKLIRYMWGFSGRIDPLLKELSNTYPNVKLITLHNDQEIKFFLKNLTKLIY